MSCSRVLVLWVGPWEEVVFVPGPEGPWTGLGVLLSNGGTVVEPLEPGRQRVVEHPERLLRQEEEPGRSEEVESQLHQHGRKCRDEGVGREVHEPLVTGDETRYEELVELLESLFRDPSVNVAGERAGVVSGSVGGLGTVPGLSTVDGVGESVVTRSTSPTVGPTETHRVSRMDS